MLIQQHELCEISLLHIVNLTFNKINRSILTGILCHSLIESTSCEDCINAITSNGDSNHPAAALSDIKASFECGDIVHPNPRFFSTIYDIELLFQKYERSPDVYELVTKEATKFVFSFACPVHAESVLSYSIHYYLGMRMRDYAIQENAECLKISAAIQKTARLMDS